MFDIGFWELSLIAAISLLILGPERLPRVARTAGLWINKMKRMVADVKSNIDEELRMEDLKELQQAGEDLKQGLTNTQQELGSAAAEFKDTVEAESGSIERTVSPPESGTEKSADTVDVASAIRESTADFVPATDKHASTKTDTDMTVEAKTITRKTAKKKKTTSRKKAVGKKSTSQKATGKPSKKSPDPAPDGGDQDVTNQNV